MPPVARHNTPVILFVTLGTQPRLPVFANARFHESFARACAQADAWRVGKYLIMPDHLHLFCTPARVERAGIKRWAAYLKERITKNLNSMCTGNGLARLGTASPSRRSNQTPAIPPMEGEDFGELSRGAVPSRQSWKWQPDCWDTQLRNQEHYHDKWEYVRMNPVRQDFVTRAEDWPWQGELHVLPW